MGGMPELLLSLPLPLLPPLFLASVPTLVGNAPGICVEKKPPMPRELCPLVLVPLFPDVEELLSPPCSVLLPPTNENRLDVREK